MKSNEPGQSSSQIDYERSGNETNTEVERKDDNNISSDETDPIKYKRNLDTLKDEKTSQHWAAFCSYYLRGTEKILKNLDSPNDFSIIPAIFLLKHSIELIVKLFSDTLEETHNTEGSINKIYKNDEKIKEKFSNNEKGIKFLEIYEKYQDSEFFMRKMENNDINIRDYKNEIFRYPRWKDVVIEEVSFENFVKNLKKEDIEELKNDIETLKDLVNDFNK